VSVLAGGRGRSDDTYATERATKPGLMRAVPATVAAGGEIEAV
jgi:hypothetical protein